MNKYAYLYELKWFIKRYKEEDTFAYDENKEDIIKSMETLVESSIEVLEIYEKGK